MVSSRIAPLYSLPISYPVQVVTLLLSYALMKVVLKMHLYATMVSASVGQSNIVNAVLKYPFNYLLQKYNSKRYKLQPMKKASLKMSSSTMMT